MSEKITSVVSEPLAHVAYLHDGSLEGLFSCIFEAYSRHELPEDIVAESDYEPRLGQSAVFVETSMEHAERVRNGIERIAGQRTLTVITRAFASDDAGKGAAIYTLVRQAVDTNSHRASRRCIMDDLADPVVARVAAMCRRTENEAEKLRQFARFSHLSNGVWFARCNPNASVVPFVMRHFAARFNIQPFIIYDEVHCLAGVYDGDGWYLVKDVIEQVPETAEGDEYAQALWQRFYDAVSIESRYHPELRRNFMPIRLWKHLPEMRPRESGITRHVRGAM